jgi:hypothetical protein
VWVASYNHYARSQPIAISDNTVLTIEFLHGQIAFVFSAPLPLGRMPNWLRDYPLQNGGKLPGIAGFAWVQSPKVGEVITLPFWFATLLVTIAGAALWLRRQFAIAVALVAWSTK